MGVGITLGLSSVDFVTVLITNSINSGFVGRQSFVFRIIPDECFYFDGITEY